MAIHYNLQKVYEISDNDSDFARQIATAFINEVPKELKEIKTNIKFKNFLKVYASAHKIKPSFDLLGMDLCLEDSLEIMNWTKDTGKKKEIMETYKSLKNKTILAIKELKKDFNLE